MRVAYDLSKKLFEKGHDVTVYTTDGCARRLDVKKNRLVDVDGINVYYFRNLSNFLRMRLKFATPYYLPFIISKEIQQFDIIHIHEHRSILAVIVHHYAKKYGIPYVLQPHGSVLPFFAKQRLKSLFDLLWGYNILNDASKVIALNKTEKEQCKKMGVAEDKIEIVPNGINLSEYKNLPRKGEFKKKYSIKNNEKIILYVGRMHKSKGIDLLVKAFTNLTNELDNVRLVLLGGDAGFQSELNQLVQKLKIEDKVIFTGFVENDEKMKAFVDADVFVTPRYSGFPLTFLESCACGTPIITTKNGDGLDWIDKKVGFIVKYDKDQLCNAMLDLLTNDKLMIRFRKEARRVIQDQFNWDKIVLNLEETYMNCKRVAKL